MEKLYLVVDLKINDLYSLKKFHVRLVAKEKRIIQHHETISCEFMYVCMYWSSAPDIMSEL